MQARRTTYDRAGTARDAGSASALARRSMERIEHGRKGPDYELEW